MPARSSSSPPSRSVTGQVDRGLPSEELICDNLWPERVSSNATRHQGPRQLNYNSTQRPPAQLNSARAKRARRASHCQHHLLTKMRLAVSFYYLVTTDVSFQSALSPNPHRLKG